KLLGSTWAVSISVVAGPVGDTEEKPVGTVHLALAGPSATTHRLLKLRGDRGQIRVQAAFGALQLLRDTWAKSAGVT
ncbi:MAG: CinA family protein, partial [Deltaproteobacteria bacterium]|nr:CinA family protein [Deltaproteobacteria bacterium]